MLFVLIRTAPFLLSALHFVFIKTMFTVGGIWFLWLSLVLILNATYFALIFLKKRDKKAIIFALHSSIFLSVGFFFLLILGSDFIINIFLLVWSLLYLLYLESILHYFYQTKKVLVVNLINIIAYINLVVVFFASAFLINFYIFISFSPWFILLISLLMSFVIILTQLEVNKIDWVRSVLYASVLSVLMTEVLIAVLFFSVSFYVSAVVVSLTYYLLSSFSLLSIKDGLTKVVILKYSVFTVSVLVAIALTSRWL